MDRIAVDGSEGGSDGGDGGGGASGDVSTGGSGAVVTQAAELHELVSGIWLAGGVASALAVLGLLVAAAPPSAASGDEGCCGCARDAAAALYLTGGVPVFAALGFVGGYGAAFRADLRQLAAHYVVCTTSSSSFAPPSAGASTAEAAAAAASAVDASVALLVTSEALLLVGMLCAAKLVGWRHVARHLMATVNGGSLLVGVGLQALALTLRAASPTVHHADDALLVLGAAVAAVSLLGLAASRPSACGRCVLPLYTLCLALVALGLAAAVAYGWLYVSPQQLDDELQAHWHLLEEELGGAAPLSRGQLLASLRHHRIVLAIAGALLGIVLLLLLLAAWLLHCLVGDAADGGQYVRAASEMSSLLYEEEDDENYGI